MEKNTEQLIKELEETKSLLNNFLAKRIEKEKSKNVYGYKEMFEAEKIERKLYSIFLNRIDPSDKEILLEVDKEIDKISEEIFQKSGWYITSDGFRKEDNFINTSDPEFATHDTYSVTRTEHGYTYDDKPPFNGYFKRIQEEEKNFCERFELELSKLHNYLTKKELIMNGQYKLINEEDKDLLNYISIYLGYNNNDIKRMLEEEKKEIKEDNNEKKL